mmetsp:Transcript_65360/g.202649  ORF Transcript_65360/g.202649 Transcript_65360/m.202649 type:complete len:205 (-) Transcript_65360:238-852(-)
MSSSRPSATPRSAAVAWSRPASTSSSSAAAWARAATSPGNWGPWLSCPRWASSRRTCTSCAGAGARGRAPRTASATWPRAPSAPRPCSSCARACPPRPTGRCGATSRPCAPWPQASSGPRSPPRSSPATTPGATPTPSIGAPCPERPRTPWTPMWPSSAWAAASSSTATARPSPCAPQCPPPAQAWHSGQRGAGSQSGLRPSCA